MQEDFYSEILTLSNCKYMIETKCVTNSWYPWCECCIMVTVNPMTLTEICRAYVLTVLQPPPCSVMFLWVSLHWANFEPHFMMSLFERCKKRMLIAQWQLSFIDIYIERKLILCCTCSVSLWSTSTPGLDTTASEGALICGHATFIRWWHVMWGTSKTFKIPPFWCSKVRRA